jgi:hypothetical protein
MFMTRVKIAAVLVLSIALLGAVGGSLAYRAMAAGNSAAAPVAPSADKPAADKKPPKDDREALQATWRLESLDKHDGTHKTKDELDGMGWVVKGDHMPGRHLGTGVVREGRGGGALAKEWKGAVNDFLPQNRLHPPGRKPPSEPGREHRHPPATPGQGPLRVQPEHETQVGRPLP